MKGFAVAPCCKVDCRIGSLEIFIFEVHTKPTVDCRIGSLEICKIFYILFHFVDCRIGSLEKYLVIRR